MTDMITMTKTTNGEVDHGRCGSANNARYKGNTPVWVIWMGDPADEIEVAQFKVKRKCVEMFNWAVQQTPENWNQFNVEAEFQDHIGQKMTDLCNARNAIQAAGGDKSEWADMQVEIERISREWFS